jgi:pilus assembly protein CpaD
MSASLLNEMEHLEMNGYAKMFRKLTLASLLLASAALAGCTNEELALESEYVPNSGSEQFPIVVEKGPKTLSIAGKSQTLSPGQINAISSFARGARPNSPVTVSRPSGSSGRLAHEIANLVAQQGVPANAIRMSSYAGSASGPVKITVTQLQARTSPCGEWPADMTDTKLNELNYNHGCAVQSNVAAMVANPEDFQTPEAVDPATAPSRVAAVGVIDKDLGATGGASASTSSAGSSAGNTGGSGGGGAGATQ